MVLQTMLPPSGKKDTSFIGINVCVVCLLFKGHSKIVDICLAEEEKRPATVSDRVSARVVGQGRWFRLPSPRSFRTIFLYIGREGESDGLVQN